MKKSRFLRALMIYCLCLAVITGAGLIVLNRFLVSYEASRPDNAVEAFFEENGKDFWLGGIDDTIKAGFNDFSDLSAGLEEFSLDPNAEVSWRSAAGGNDSVQYYDVRLGSSRVGRLTVIPAEDVGFGFKSWVVSDCSFSPGTDTTITISVPSGSTAAVNGVEVGSEYLSSNGSVNVNLGHNFDIAPDSDVYVIEGMRGPVDIKAYDADGTELEPNEISGTEVEFLPEPEYSFSFYASTDAQVSVNGTDITGTYCANIGGNVHESAQLLLYECSGLYTQPEILVSVNGSAVDPVQLGMGTVYAPNASAEASEEVRAFLTDFIKAYCVFSNNQNDNPTGNFFALAQYLQPESEFYDTLLKSCEAVSWIKERIVTYRGIDVYDVIPMSDGSFICHIEYRLSIQYTGTVYEPDTTCVVLVVPNGNSYQVAGMANEM